MIASFLTSTVAHGLPFCEAAQSPPNVLAGADKVNEKME
jgi:hypothetical protein